MFFRNRSVKQVVILLVGVFPLLTLSANAQKGAVGYSASSAAGPAAKAIPLASVEKMPVREATIFKDGHAFLMHESEMATDEQGNVQLDYQLQPVLGTFWPYSADPKAKLKATSARNRLVSIERTALNLTALIEANKGAQAIITEIPTVQQQPPKSYPAKIAGLLTRSSEELQAARPVNAPEPLPVKSDIVLLETPEGTKALPIARIQDVTFPQAPNPRLAEEEFRSILSMQMQWEGEPAKTAKVGLIYLQLGLRWIPNYKVTIDGEGNAHVELQATLVNELTDLENVRVNLVVGVPTFAFKDNADPISLQQTLVQLSQHFNRDSQMRLSNAIMTQQAMPVQMPQPEGSPTRALNLGPEVGTGDQTEDLFIFPIENVTLKSGERMVIPVARFDLKYKDVYALDIPWLPPSEIASRADQEQLREMDKFRMTPQVIHKLRLENNSSFPLTTAPTLIMSKGLPQAQSLMTYTAQGGTVDLPVTNAGDIRATKSDLETGRVPNALNVNGNNYTRITVGGKISLKNYRKETVELEVSRYVIGNLDEAQNGGRVDKGDIFDHQMLMGAGAGTSFWSSYNWPSGLRSVNGVGRAFWKVTLEPGAATELNYGFHYFWM
ncbi:MAG TPA: hypothetical protein PLA90_15495 [Candidatus Sumerlaeota bacterium]|nr:hypothetical protein [Candidatus Sumerlaeota bacterium]